MLFKTENDKYYHTLFDESGETGEYTPLILKEVDSELRYYFDDNNLAVEYFRIDANGNFLMYDMLGEIIKLERKK